MSGFFDVGEDAIERWHQICMRHYARIWSLRSAKVQKNCQAKHGHACNNVSLKNIIANANNAEKRNLKRNEKLSTQNKLRKKYIREQRRIRIKEETKEEPRVQMKIHREQAKEECPNPHAIK